MGEKARRIMMTVAGVSISGVSVGFFEYSRFGMDPFQLFAHGTWYVLPDGWMGFGTFYACLCAVLLAAVFFAGRCKLGLGTVINLFLLGYIAEFSQRLLTELLPEPGMAVRAAFLLAGIVVMCLSSSLYFTADLGVSVYDAVSLILSEKKGWSFRLCRIGTDLLCTAVGFALGATVGVGTLVTAFFMGPLIAFFNRTVAEPLRYGRRKK